MNSVNLFDNSIILLMTKEDIMEWLDDEEEDYIREYLAFYERMEYYEVCCILRDYLNLYYS